MSVLVSIFILLVYGIGLIISYRFIMKRLKFLDELHMKNTGITELKGYVLVKKKVFIIFIILFIIFTFVFLTFVRSELLYMEDETSQEKFASSFNVF